MYQKPGHVQIPRQNTFDMAWQILCTKPRIFCNKLFLTSIEYLSSKQSLITQPLDLNEFLFYMMKFIAVLTWEHKL